MLVRLGLLLVALVWGTKTCLAEEIGSLEVINNVELETEQEQLPFVKNILEVPLLFAHDAAMAYFPPHGRRAECRHYKTQSFRTDAPFHFKPGTYPSGFSSLLDCGARALDLRLSSCATLIGKRKSKHPKMPKNLTGEVCMHHGAASLYHVTFESELYSIVRWAKENPGEVVLLKIVPDLRYNRPDPTLMENIKAALAEYNIPSILNSDMDGNPLNGCWNGGKPWKMWRSRLKGVLAVWKFDIGSTGQPDLTISCVNDNFLPEVGFNPNHVSKSFEFLNSYVQQTLHHAFDRSGTRSKASVFQELQMIWQSASTEIHYGILGYNLLDVNSLSHMNAYVRNATLRHKDLFSKHANLVKLNNLCQYGPDIAEALGTKVKTLHRERCSHMCNGENHFNPCWR